MELITGWDAAFLAIRPITVNGSPFISIVFPITFPSGNRLDAEVLSSSATFLFSEKSFSENPRPFVI